MFPLKVQANTLAVQISTHIDGMNATDTKIRFSVISTNLYISFKDTKDLLGGTKRGNSYEKKLLKIGIVASASLHTHRE